MNSEKVLLVLLLGVALLLATHIQAAPSVSIPQMKVPGNVTLTVTVVPGGGRGTVATLLFTPTAPGPVTLQSIYGYDTWFYPVSPRAVYINGSPVTLPATVQMSSRTNITAVFASDVIEATFTLREPLFFTQNNVVFDLSYPVSVVRMTAQLTVSTIIGSPTEICGVDVQVSLLFQNPVVSASVAHLSSGNLGTLEVQGNTVVFDVYGTPGFTVSLNVDLAPVTIGDYTVVVGGYTAPPGATLFLTNDIVVQAPNSTLITYFNGSTSKPNSYGVYSLEAAGIRRSSFTLHPAGPSDYVYTLVYVNVGLVKYYKLNLQEKSSSEAWILTSSGFGNQTLALVVNGTKIIPKGQDKLVNVHYILPYVTSGWIALPGKSLTYTVNDTTKSVDVVWNNTAYKTVVGTVYDLIVSVNKSKSPRYVKTEIARRVILYSENAPSSVSINGKRLSLSLNGMYVLFTGSDVLKVMNTRKTMEIQKNIVHGIDFSGDIDLVARIFVFVHNHNSTVAGAYVNLYDANTGALLESKYTDNNGLAMFIVPPLKSYLVEVESAGEVHTETVTITDTDALVEFSVTAVPSQPIITIDMAVLIMVFIAFAMLILFAYYVLSTRGKVIVVE